MKAWVGGGTGAPTQGEARGVTYLPGRGLDGGLVGVGAGGTGENPTLRG